MTPSRHLLSGLLPNTLYTALIAAPRLLHNNRQQHQSQALCTASLLDTRNAHGKSGPAYVVTSSHCLHRLGGLVHEDLPIKGSVNFNYFDDTLETIKAYPLKTLKWSSSQGVDLAIVELHTSLASLIDDGITPLKLAEAAPADGADILTLTARLSTPATPISTNLLARKPPRTHRSVSPTR